MLGWLGWLCCPPGRLWVSPFHPLGLSFSTCTLTGFLLSTCCMWAWAVCEQDTVLALQKLTFWWQEQIAAWQVFTKPCPTQAQS